MVWCDRSGIGGSRWFSRMGGGAVVHNPYDDRRGSTTAVVTTSTGKLKLFVNSLVFVVVEGGGGGGGCSFVFCLFVFFCLFWVLFCLGFFAVGLFCLFVFWGGFCCCFLKEVGFLFICLGLYVRVRARACMMDRGGGRWKGGGEQRDWEDFAGVNARGFRADTSIKSEVAFMPLKQLKPVSQSTAWFS